MEHKRFESSERASAAGFIAPSKLADFIAMSKLAGTDVMPDYRGFELVFEKYRIIPEPILGTNPIPSDWCNERILQAAEGGDLPVVFAGAFVEDALNNMRTLGAYTDLVDTNKIPDGVTAAHALIDKIYRDYWIQFRPHLPSRLSDWKYSPAGLATETPTVLVRSRASGAITSTEISAKDPLDAITSAVTMQRNEWAGDVPETTVEEDVEWWRAKSGF